MYNISLYTSILHDQSHALNAYAGLIESNLIARPKMFCDKRLTKVVSQIPVFNTWHLCSAQEFLLSDNTAYDIADVFPSNTFIAIDVPCRHSASNVFHYSIEPFLQLKEREDTIKLLTEILNQKEFEQYVQVQQSV